MNLKITPVNNTMHQTLEFLSLSLTLHPMSNGKRALSFGPFNKRHGFSFVFPMLTVWSSKTPESVKRAAFKTMIQYAMVASTVPELSIEFLKKIVDRLVLNGYPMKVLQSMWLELAKETLYTIPCRPPIAAACNRIVNTIRRYIRTSY